MQITENLPACPVETTLMLIGDKWKVLILRDLLTGTKRFGELKKSVGNVSQKVLTAQLRDMEEKGLITRTVYAEVPPRVEYSLTELGQSLKPILVAMKAWGTEYKAMNSCAASGRDPVASRPPRRTRSYRAAHPAGGTRGALFPRGGARSP